MRVFICEYVTCMRKPLLWYGKRKCVLFAHLKWRELFCFFLIGSNPALQAYFL